MKQFIFDRLVDRENICDLEREQEALSAHVRTKANTVVYAPRNCGKTSLVRNVVIDDFRRRHRKGFVLFADLLGVRSAESLVARLAASLERSFEASFPVRNLLENARRFLSSLRPEVSLDPETGSPSLSLRPGDAQPRRSLTALWEHIGRICSQVPSLVVLDEFQDVAFVEEGPALMRASLEALGGVPVILLGSKRHMLAQLFARPQAPLAGWGSDIEFRPIPYEAYHAYIAERFRQRRLRIAAAEARTLQDMMQRVPEAINRLCQQIMDSHREITVTAAEIHAAVRKLVESREGRFEAYLARFPATDQRVLRALAVAGRVDRPHSKAFLAATGLSNRTAGLSVRRLLDDGVVERHESGYRLGDPLLRIHLLRYR